MSMGHIITGLAIHFVPRKLTILGPLERQIFDEDFMVRVEVIIDFRRLEELDNRRCYQLCQTALRYGDVPLPKVVKNYDDVSEEKEEDVKPQVSHEKDSKGKAKKKNRAPKRKRFEDC